MTSITELPETGDGLWRGSFETGARDANVGCRTESKHPAVPGPVVRPARNSAWRRGGLSAWTGPAVILGVKRCHGSSVRLRAAQACPRFQARCAMTARSRRTSIGTAANSGLLIEDHRLQEGAWGRGPPSVNSLGGVRALIHRKSTATRRPLCPPTVSDMHAPAALPLRCSPSRWAQGARGQ